MSSRKRKRLSVWDVLGRLGHAVRAGHADDHDAIIEHVFTAASRQTFRGDDGEPMDGDDFLVSVFESLGTTTESPGCGTPEWERLRTVALRRVVARLSREGLLDSIAVGSVTDARGMDADCETNSDSPAAKGEGSVADAVDGDETPTATFWRDASAPFWIDRVVGAGGGRRLDLAVVWIADGIRLGSMTDPQDGTSMPLDRTWNFEYEATTGRLSRIINSMGYKIDITYDSAGHIETITDKHDGSGIDTYTYTHDVDGRLLTVLDPDPSDPAKPRLTQNFDTMGVDPDSVYGTYTDRRGNDWEYRYSFFDAYGPSAFAPLLQLYDPLSVVALTSKTLDFDSDHNLVTFTDELDHDWTYTYDARGNRLTATDPVGFVQGYSQVWTYDALNNVTSYTDAAGNVVTFAYDATYQTLVKTITEPGPALTTMTYFPDTDPDRFGLLDAVTDPNGVVTGFDYDLWGQPSAYREGADPNLTGGFIVDCSYGYDSGGRLVHSACSPGGVNIVSNDGNTIASFCKPGKSRGSSTPFGLPSGFPTLPGSPAVLQEISAAFNGAQYSPKRELESLPVQIWVDGVSEARPRILNYNELGLMTYDNTAGRSFVYDYDLQGGTLSRRGPDWHTTLVEYDAANRVMSVTRDDAAGTTIMSATYTYLANGLVDEVVYADGLGARIKYAYDDANRVTSIHHKNVLLATILKLDYTYTDNNLVADIVETNSNGYTSSTEFTYDVRGRLTREWRNDYNTTRNYDWTYVYDAGGNRKLKRENRPVDPLISRYEERYEYDIQNTTLYGTNNNRLMKIERWQIERNSQQSSSSSGDGGGIELAGSSESLAPLGGGTAAAGGGGFPPPPSETETLLQTKYYFYSSDGDVLEDGGTVERIVTEIPGDSHYTAVRFGYGVNTRTVTHVLGEEWDVFGSSPPTNYNVTFARQFRYDGARQRYLNRELDTAKLMQNPPVYESLADTWSDYDGDSIYADWTFDSQVVDLMSYMPGVAMTDQLLGGGAVNTTYLHTSALGSTMATSDSTGLGTFDAAYTAFGENVMGDTGRYGFAGAHGYQTDDYQSPDDFTIMHLGARYYNAATGRFLQRDPIGILDGTNVYAYVRNRPTVSVDPSGLHAGGGHNTNIPGDGVYSPPAPPITPPPHRPSPPPGSAQDLRNQRRDEKIFQVAVEGVAALCALAGGPVAVGVVIGIVIVEVVEGVQNANDEAAGG